MAVQTATPAVRAGQAPWKAQWIWAAGDDVHGYNRAVRFRRDFFWDGRGRVTLRITADSFYRLFLNGRWINDGPCRSWPEHYQYDAIDATRWLRRGTNRIEAIARYYGVGDFHRVPQQAGFLAQLDRIEQGRAAPLVWTDASWSAKPAPEWIRSAPKVSIQMEPAEVYDARLEGREPWRAAEALFPAEAGPWKDLHPRDAPLLTKIPAPPARFVRARAVRARGTHLCVPAARLAHPGLIEANNNVSCAGGLATMIETAAPAELEILGSEFRLALDGKRIGRGRHALKPGPHLLLGFVAQIVGHAKEKSLDLVFPPGAKLVNPIDPDAANPWCYIRLREFAFATNDLRWIAFRSEDRRIAKALREYDAAVSDWLRRAASPEAFRKLLGARAETLSREALFVTDPIWKFQHQQPVPGASARVDRPEGALYEALPPAVAHPNPRGDLELLYDLGVQRCGYYELVLEAEAGATVDVAGVEYIAPDGRIQHTGRNRNGLRYITKAGLNRFVSLKRRSGRYLFLTLRNFHRPIRIHLLRVIESVYPIEQIGDFACSDGRLNQIWDISLRTLKLCMEDTFTDCPLYEQTLWVGDARNESLFAYGVFGATDLARRCIRLTAQSLDRYPMVGGQVPSCWDMILPAWSFLWGVSTWDYYWRTGDKAFLREVWPAALQNLRGAERCVDERGLFTAPFWNFFDWTGIDQNRKTVLHNTMFFVGAIDAALKEAEVLGDSKPVPWLRRLRARLVAGVNRLWDPAKGAYPDAVGDDGRPSPKTSQHTSFLAVLFDIAEPDYLDAIRRNLLNPPPGMTRIGSPFAAFYLYQAMEKLGLEEEIIRAIYANYLPMLEAGATTVWESFPSGTTGSNNFPTRSHCHAWSSAPCYYLPRVILGLRAVAPGGEQWVLSPRLCGLEWARGTVATQRGPIHVRWRRRGEQVRIRCEAPEGVRVLFQPNKGLQGLEVKLEGAVQAKSPKR